MEPFNNPHDVTSKTPSKDSNPSSVRARFTHTVIQSAQRIQGMALALMVLMIGVSLTVLVVVFTFAYLRDRTLADELVSVRPVGIVKSVHLPDSFWGHALVETDTGWYSLTDGVNLNKGELLTLERFANHDRYLCDTDHYCVKLARSFLHSGPTIPKSPAQQK